MLNRLVVSAAFYRPRARLLAIDHGLGNVPSSLKVGGQLCRNILRLLTVGLGFTLANAFMPACFADCGNAIVQDVPVQCVPKTLTAAEGAIRPFFCSLD